MYELNAINKYVDRYQIWIIWLMEAKSQYHACIAQNDEACLASEQTENYTTKFGPKRGAEALRSYSKLLN